MRRIWVRGKALQSLLALRPLQKGDEVLAVPYEEHRREYMRWKTPKVTRLSDTDKIYCRCTKRCIRSLTTVRLDHFMLVGWRLKEKQ